MVHLTLELFSFVMQIGLSDVYEKNHSPPFTTILGIGELDSSSTVAAMTNDDKTLADASYAPS